jgi:hypothetical protein
MPIVQKTYLYEVLARFTAEGLQGCHKIEITETYDDVTGQVFAATAGSAMSISQEEAADLIYNATLAPEPDPETE